MSKGSDAFAGVVWLAIAGSPWPGVALCAGGLITLAIGRR